MRNKLINGKQRAVSHTAYPDYKLPCFNSYQFYLQTQYDLTFGIKTADNVLNRQIQQHKEEFSNEGKHRV